MKKSDKNDAEIPLFPLFTFLPLKYFVPLHLNNKPI